MNTLRVYSHHAIEWVNDLTGERECRMCPRPITGSGDTLRHVDEAVQPHAIAPADRAAVNECVARGARALSAMWTDHVSDMDRARVVVEELYRCGALNTRSRRRRVAA